MTGETLRYEIEYHITGIRDDDHDARFKVRRNGKVFYIELSPSKFINSPITTKTYLSYLEVLKSGEEVLGDIYDTDVYDWVVAPFKPLLASLAPSPGDVANTRVTLQEYSFPQFFILTLDIVDEERRPRRIPANKSPYRPTFVRFDDKFLDDLETWTAFYDPAGIIMSCENPEDALFKPPRKVLIDNGRTQCFFKPCHGNVQAIEELKTYKMIHAAGLNLDPQLKIATLHGIVMDDCSFILGLLLTYIDCGDGPLSAIVHPNEPDEPPRETRQRWLQQLDSTLRALHKNDIVWGDVKAENILIDTDSNAWIIDFGGGYTEGWVTKEDAGTMIGDLAAMAKVRELLLP